MNNMECCCTYWYLTWYIIVCAIGLYAYNCLLNKFWIWQPVCFKYGLNYLIGPHVHTAGSIIRTHLPVINTFVCFDGMYCATIATMRPQYKRMFATFIRKFYMKNGHNKYAPLSHNIFKYFKDTDLISLKFTPHNKLCGTIHTRQLRMTFQKNSMNVWYVDHLCVHPLFRESGVAQNLIQTHEHFQCHHLQKSVVSMFRSEGACPNLLVPICSYTMYCFDMQVFNRMQLDNSINNPEHTSNIHDEVSISFAGTNSYAVDIIYSKSFNSRWDVSVLTDRQTLSNLIESGNILIGCVWDKTKDDSLISIHIFRKSCTYISKNKEMAICIASYIVKRPITDMELCLGFYKLTSAMQNKYAYLGIECVSDNEQLMTSTCIKSIPYYTVCPIAYYMYNMSYTEQCSAKVFIVL